MGREKEGGRYSWAGGRHPTEGDSQVTSISQHLKVRKKKGMEQVCGYLVLLQGYIVLYPKDSLRSLWPPDIVSRKQTFVAVGAHVRREAEPLGNTHHDC